MKVRIAQEADFNVVDNLLKETAKRLKQKGSKQWAHVLTNEEQATVKKHLSQKEILLVEENKEPIGMCYLYQTPNDWDYGLWQMDKKENQYYLHKLVVNNKFVGRQYGEKVLSAICQWVKKEQGEVILLDCKADVTYLNNFYQKVGFKLVGKKTEDDFSELFADFNLYEYQLNH